MLEGLVCAAGELRAHFISNPALQRVVYTSKRETEGTIFLPARQHFISSACSQLPWIVDNSQKSLESSKLICSPVHLLWVVYTKCNGPAMVQKMETKAAGPSWHGSFCGQRSKSPLQAARLIKLRSVKIRTQPRCELGLCSVPGHSYNIISPSISSTFLCSKHEISS